VSDEVTNLNKQMLGLIWEAQDNINNMLLGQRYEVGEDELSGKKREYLNLCRRIKTLVEKEIKSAGAKEKTVKFQVRKVTDWNYKATKEFGTLKELLEFVSEQVYPGTKAPCGVILTKGRDTWKKKGAWKITIYDDYRE